MEVPSTRMAAASTTKEVSMLGCSSASRAVMILVVLAMGRRSSGFTPNRTRPLLPSIKTMPFALSFPKGRDPTASAGAVSGSYTGSLS